MKRLILKNVIILVIIILVACFFTYKIYNRFGQIFGLIIYYTLFLPYIIVSIIRGEGIGQLIKKVKQKLLHNK